jgi:hypothetical protein
MFQGQEKLSDQIDMKKGIIDQRNLIL